MVRKTGIITATWEPEDCVCTAILGRREENVELNEMPAYRGTDVEGGRFSWEKLLLLRISFAHPPPPTESQWLQVWGWLFACLGALGEPMSLEPEH